LLFAKLKAAYSSELSKVFLIGLASRLLIFAAAIIGDFFFGPGMAKPNASSPFINLFSQWDAAWYNNIAVNWYPPGAEPLSGNWAFFPLYPALMRIFGAPLTPFMLPEQAYYVAGFLISNVLFFVCIALFYKVTKTIFNNKKYALLSTVFFAFWPGALFYSNVYTESLFMVFMLGAFYFLEKDQPAKATTLAFFAALTRSNGFMILLPFAYHGMQTRKYKTAAVQSFIILLPYLLFNVYGYFLTGLFPVRELVYSQIWGPYISAPITLAPTVIAEYALLFITEGVLIALPFVQLAKEKLPIRTLVEGLIQRKDLKYWVLAIFLVLMLIGYSDPKNIHRYILPMLPLYWTYATIWNKNSVKGKILLGIFTVLLIIGAVLFATGYWVI
jgi:hypothetical protein